MWHIKVGGEGLLPTYEVKFLMTIGVSFNPDVLDKTIVARLGGLTTSQAYVDSDLSTTDPRFTTNNTAMFTALIIT